MVRVFIGTSKGNELAERSVRSSILAHASGPVELIYINLGFWSGCTGFSLYRYAVPELAGYDGYAIYLDVDMLLQADVYELLEYKQKGRWVCVKADYDPRGYDDCVSVIDCSAFKAMPKIQELPRQNKWTLKSRINPMVSIPLEWNVTDRFDPNAKLIHMTDLETQPWLHGVNAHPDSELTKLWLDYAMM